MLFKDTATRYVQPPRFGEHSEKCTRSRSTGLYKILLLVLGRSFMQSWWSGLSRPQEGAVGWWGNFHLLERAFPSLAWEFEPYTQAFRWSESFYIKSRYVRYLLQLHPNAKWQQSRVTTSPQFVRYLEDAEKFILSYRSIIERAPLQTYRAALAFSLTKSEVKIQHSKEKLSFIKKVSVIREDWDPCLQTLEGHSHWVKAVSISFSR